MDTSEQVLHSKVDKVIAMLDRYLFLNGKTLTSHYYDDATTFFHPDAPSNDLPASWQYFPPITQGEHLANQSLEVAEVALLRQRITKACADAKVIDAIRNVLAEKYAQVKGAQADVENYKRKNVAAMLALLRAEEKKAREPAVQTFTLRAVNEIDDDGKVRRIAVYSQPHDASWKEIQKTLTTMTLWQAQNFGYPKGYSLRDGNWTYQTTKGAKLDKTHHDLTNTEQYRAMRRMLDKDSAAGVLIWHEITYYTCMARKADALKQRNQRIRDLSQRIREFEGSPQPHEKADDYVEPEDLPELMGDWAFDMPSPSVELLVEDE